MVLIGKHVERLSCNFGVQSHMTIHKCKWGLRLDMNQLQSQEMKHIPLMSNYYPPALQCTQRKTKKKKQGSCIA